MFVETMFLDTMSGPIWSILYQFSPFLTSLNMFEQDWTNLVCLDPISSSLNKFVQVWSSLIKSDQVWSILDRSSLK